jgi:hypothetical protein
MTFTQKQIETILSLPTEYVFRYSMQQKIDNYVPLAGDIILRSLQSGLEPRHIVAFMNLFSSYSNKQKSLKKYLSMCLPQDEALTYLEKFESMNDIRGFISGYYSENIELTPQAMDDITHLLKFVRDYPDDIQNIIELTDRYSASESAKIISMKDLSCLLYLLQPTVCPILDYSVTNRDYLIKNLNYDGKYSTYIHIFNEIKKHKGENNMLHISFMLQIDTVYRCKFIAQAAASLADSCESYWDMMYEDAIKKEKEKKEKQEKENEEKNKYKNFKNILKNIIWKCKFF